MSPLWTSIETTAAAGSCGRFRRWRMVARAAVRVVVTQVQAESARLDAGRHVLADHPGAHHRLEHLCTARHCGLRMADRVVERRLLRKPGEQRRLREVERLRRLAEEDARGRLHSDRLLTGRRSEAHVVQVVGEDLVLRAALLHLLGERGLLDLALEAAIA